MSSLSSSVQNKPQVAGSNADRHPMVTCPYCHQRAMSTWDKLWSHRLNGVCAVCGKKLAVSRWSALAAALPAIGGLVANRVASFELGILAIALGTLIGLLLVAFVAPMVGRDV